MFRGKTVEAEILTGIRIIAPGICSPLGICAAQCGWERKMMQVLARIRTSE
jgi:hypothetical protein